MSVADAVVGGKGQMCDTAGGDFPVFHPRHKPGFSNADNRYLRRIDHAVKHTPIDRRGRATRRAPVAQATSLRRYSQAHSEAIRNCLSAMGPIPRGSMKAMIDLGLTDEEVARYFRVPRTAVSTLRQLRGIQRDH